MALFQEMNNATDRPSEGATLLLLRSEKKLRIAASRSFSTDRGANQTRRRTYGHQKGEFIMNPTEVSLADKVNTEIVRLDAHDTATNCYGLVAYADALLPLGWLRVSDGNVSAYGPGEEILAELQQLEDDAGWESAWEVLYHFEEKEPCSSQEWPRELLSCEQLEEGCDNDEPLTLCKIITNSGEYWTAGPHGAFTCAVSDAFRYGDWHKTREKALEKTAEFLEDDGDEE
jgi:hypothetical protein